MHYHVNQRDDSQLWRDLREMDIPESLAEKIKLFKETGKIFREQNDLFNEGSWLQVMLGQGIEPEDYHPLANDMPLEQLNLMLAKIKAIKHEPLTKLPSHDEYLTNFCRL